MWTSQNTMVDLLDLVTAAFIYCSLVLVGVWCWVRWTHRHLVRAASNLPSLFPTVPILGSLHYTVFGSEKMTAYGIDALIKLSSRGIFTCCVWLGPYPVICVFGVEDIKTVNSIMKVPERGFEMDTLKFLLRNGLLTAPDNIWMSKRRTIEPIFHRRNLKQLMPTFNKNSRELVDRMSQYEGRGSVDVSTVIIGTSIQSISHLIFGPDLDFDINSEEFSSLIDLVKKAPEIELQKIFKFWLQSDIIFSYLYRKEIKTMNLQWEKFSTTPLKICRRNSESSNLQHKSFVENHLSSKSETTNEGPLNLVSVCSALQHTFTEFTEKDFKSEIMTMYVAGSDSTSNAVSYCLLLLAYHQDVQERLYKEISVFKDAHSDITADDLQKMPYLDQVFKETLRWSMVIPYSSRRTYEEIKLSSCKIPKDSCFILVNIGPFLDPKIYPDPTRFNPEHFSDDNTKGRDKSAFLPFNGGPRVCIGKLYTELLAKTIIVHVLRAFKLSTGMDVYKLKRKMDVFISSSEGYNIIIERR